MTKRFRTSDGKLTMSLTEIKKATAKVASAYYQIGSIYQYAENNEEYVYIDKDEQLAHFQSFDGKNLFIPLDSLGTYLPDVASTGRELARTE